MQATDRRALPQAGGPTYLADGGLETVLVFQEGIELPSFAAFPLLETGSGRAVLRRYFDGFVEIARRDGRGLVLDTVTWRSNPDWGAALGYAPEALNAVNVAAVAFAAGIRDAAETGRRRCC